MAELVEAAGPFDGLRDLGLSRLQRRWLSLSKPPGAGLRRAAVEVAELVEAAGPFDGLRDLGDEVAELVEATGT